MMHIALQVSGLQLPPDELLLDALVADELLDELEVAPLDELDEVPPEVELLDEVVEELLKPEDEAPDADDVLEDVVEFPPPSPGFVSNSESVPMAQLHIKRAGRTKAKTKTPSRLRIFAPRENERNCLKNFQRMGGNRRAMPFY